MNTKSIRGAASVTLMAVLLLVLAAPVTGQSGQVTFELTITGDVSAGETHQLFFDPGGVGQTGFAFCAPGVVPLCEAGTLSQAFAGLDEGASFTYRFERVAPDGSLTVYSEGAGVVGVDTVISATYHYATLPDVAVAHPAVPPGLPVLAGLVLVGIAVVTVWRTVRAL